MTPQSGVPIVSHDFVALTLHVFKFHEEKDSARDFSPWNVKVTLSSKRWDPLLSDAASLSRTLESHVNNITLN
jgi:hypothetical protein